MYTTIRMISLGLTVTVLLVPGVAVGDLYCEGALTLDWLVDSSDEIHRVRFSASESAAGYVAESHEALKPAPGKSVLKQGDVDRFRPTRRGMETGECLIFVRMMKGAPTRVVR